MKALAEVFICKFFSSAISALLNTYSSIYHGLYRRMKLIAWSKKIARSSISFVESWANHATTLTYLHVQTNFIGLIVEGATSRAFRRQSRLPLRTKEVPSQQPLTPVEKKNRLTSISLDGAFWTFLKGPKSGSTLWSYTPNSRIFAECSANLAITARLHQLRTITNFIGKNF